MELRVNDARGKAWRREVGRGLMKGTSASEQANIAERRWGKPFRLRVRGLFKV